MKGNGGGSLTGKKIIYENETCKDKGTMDLECRVCSVEGTHGHWKD